MLRPSFRYCQRREGRNVSTLPVTINKLLAQSAAQTDLSPQDVAVNGWVKSVRRQKRVTFAEIRDGSTHKTLQAVFSPEQGNLISPGGSVSLIGKIVPTPKAAQPVELAVQSIQILGECDTEVYPMQKRGSSVQHLRENAHLRPRTSSIANTLRLRSRVKSLLEDYFQQQEFIYVHPPILTSSDCEGGGEVFRVLPDRDVPQSMVNGLTNPREPTSQNSFFSKPAFLTVSSQLHLEALSSALNRVYTISPAFRAEASQTNRHLAEFWMLEAEMSFVRDLSSVMDIVESALKHVMRSLESDEHAMAQLEALKVKPERPLPWNGLSERPWARITYSNAIDMLAKTPNPPRWGDSLSSEHEKWLALEVAGPVFVTDYPASLKPFYMRVNTAQSTVSGPTVSCFDLLVPSVAEIVGGSLREERLSQLEEAMTAQGMPLEDYQWYLDLRRYGTVPHGGFGLGFERFVSWITGVDNVRECIAFPRWAGRMAG